jgi:hypothetical protein
MESPKIHEHDEGEESSEDDNQNKVSTMEEDQENENNVEREFRIKDQVDLINFLLTCRKVD